MGEFGKKMSASAMCHLAQAKQTKSEKKFKTTKKTAKIWIPYPLYLKTTNINRVFEALSFDSSHHTFSITSI